MGNFKFTYYAGTLPTCGAVSLSLPLSISQFALRFTGILSNCKLLPLLYPPPPCCALFTVCLALERILLTCCLDASLPAPVCSIPCRGGISIALPAVGDPISRVHVWSDNVCVLCVTYNDFRAQIVQNLRWALVLTPAQREGSSLGDPTGACLFRMLPFFRDAPFGGRLPLIEAQTGENTVCNCLACF